MYHIHALLLPPVSAAHKFMLSSFKFETDNRFPPKLGPLLYVSHGYWRTRRGVPRVRAASRRRASYARQPPYANAVRQVAPDGVDGSAGREQRRCLHGCLLYTEELDYGPVPDARGSLGHEQLAGEHEAPN